MNLYNPSFYLDENFKVENLSEQKTLFTPIQIIPTSTNESKSNSSGEVCIKFEKNSTNFEKGDKGET